MGQIVGQDGSIAKVTPDGHAVSRAVTEEHIIQAAYKGDAYSWVSATGDIDTGDTRLYVRNNSPTPLILDRLTVNGSNVICEWTILKGEASTTPSGTAVTGVSLYTGADADATAFDDETAVADGSIIDRVWTPITNTIQHSLKGIILRKNQYIQINQITESTTGSVTLFGHYGTPAP